MLTSGPKRLKTLKGWETIEFNSEQWNKRWNLIEQIANIKLLELVDKGQPHDSFKIERTELKRYLDQVAKNEGYHDYSKMEAALHLGPIDNSIVLLPPDPARPRSPHRLILMDHNAIPGDYKIRYLGQGKFGKVKLGLDRYGAKYAVKNERKRVGIASEREQAIMRKKGVLIGTVYRETKTPKPWIDGGRIQEKELSVMIFNEGETLDKYITPGEKFYREFTPLELHIIALGVIKAIDNLNKLGIVHRDQALDNFMIDMTQLPPDMTKIDLAQYLSGENPEYDFRKLITEIDYGLSFEVPIDGQECQLESPAQFCRGRTAPEYYLDKRCSTKSENYTVSKFIKEKLGINNDLIDTLCPDKLVELTTQYENLLNERIKLHLEVKAKFLEGKNSFNADAANYPPFMAARDSYNAVMELENQALNKLTRALELYPPKDRLSLQVLFEGLKAKALQLQFEQRVSLSPSLRSSVSTLQESRVPPSSSSSPIPFASPAASSSGSPSSSDSPSFSSASSDSSPRSLTPSSIASPMAMSASPMSTDEQEDPGFSPESRSPAQAARERPSERQTPVTFSSLGNIQAYGDSDDIKPSLFGNVQSYGEGEDLKPSLFGNVQSYGENEDLKPALFENLTLDRPKRT